MMVLNLLILPSKMAYQKSLLFHRTRQPRYFLIGTNAGIARLDIDKYYSTFQTERDAAIQIIQQEQGLISDEANLGAVYEDENGELWFGTVDGVSKFNPKEYRNQVEPYEINNFWQRLVEPTT